MAGGFLLQKLPKHNFRGVLWAGILAGLLWFGSWIAYDLARLWRYWNKQQVTNYIVFGILIVWAIVLRVQGRTSENDPNGETEEDPEESEEDPFEVFREAEEAEEEG